MTTYYRFSRASTNGFVRMSMRKPSDSTRQPMPRVWGEAG